MLSPKRTDRRAIEPREPGTALREWQDELIQGELIPILIQLERIAFGERGEKIVGATLKELRCDGYEAVHSLRPNKCDIDHVLVGPGGVFVIETKHGRGAGLITFRNGQGIFVGERKRWNTALTQAKAGAREVQRIVKEGCGISEGVWPVVVFVGRWQVADQWESTDAHVFTPESLQDYVRQQQPVLKRSEIEMIAAKLEETGKS